MPTPDQTPQPFWKKIFNGASANDSPAHDGSGSVLDNILSIAGKTTETPLVETMHSPDGQRSELNTPPHFRDEEASQAAARMSFAQSTFASVAGISLLISIGCYVGVFDEENGFLGKFGVYNLPATIEAKDTLATALKTDLSDTQRFIAMMQLEAIATKVSNLDLDDSNLNYRPPENGPISPEDGSVAVYRTTNERGDLIEIPATEIEQRQSMRATRTASARTALQEILLIADNLKNNKKLPTNIATQAKSLLGYLDGIDLVETDFPSAVTRTNFHLAQGIARTIVSDVKEKNLANLIADLKKQAHTIDTHAANLETQSLVAELTTLLDSISAKKPSTFTNALTRANAIRNSLSSINDDTIYRKMITIIGDGDAREGDLTAAANIAQNLSRETAINHLDANRIAWSSIIETTEKISRLGTDQLTDNGEKFSDARKDIDPAGKIFRFTSYAAKSDKREIEIHGRAIGSGTYTGKNFTALADLTDALETSPVFKNIEMNSYTKAKDVSGTISSPVSIKLELQNAGERDTRDISLMKPAGDTQKTQSIAAPKKINTTNPKDSPATTQPTNKKTDPGAFTETPAVETKSPVSTSTNTVVATPTMAIFVALDTFFTK